MARAKAINAVNSIRSAVLADVEALVEIEQRTNSAPWCSSHIYEGVEQQQAIIVEQAETNKIQAYLIGQEVSDEASLLHIIVDKQSQSKGIGRQLLMHWLAALSGDVKKVWLEVRESNKAAQALYEKLSFTRQGVRKKYYRTMVSDQKEDAIIYCLNRS